MTLDYTFERRIELTQRDYLEKGRAEERANCIKNMLISGLSPERIVEICNYQIEEVKEVKSKLKI